MASKINDYIEGFFKCFTKASCNNSTISYESNNCFKHFFEIKECEDSILGVHYLVPAFLFSEVKPYKYTNIPVQISSNPIKNLSETTLLRELGQRSYYNHRVYHLHKLKNKAEEIYYGTNGIILDSNFNILIMVVFKVINNNIVDTLCYINPKIFINEKRTVEKIIIKKILPFICINNIDVNNFYAGRITPVFKDVTKQYIHKPKEPGKEVCDDYINNELISWEDDVLDYLDEHFNE